VSLADVLAALPDSALLPVGWVRAQLLDSAPLPVDTPELAVAAFARLMGRSAATVRSWCERGLIPGAYKLPGDRRHAAWRIPAAAVVAFRAAHAAQPDHGSGPAPPAEPQTGAALTIRDWRAVRRPRRAKR
jgi:hypothetical protein